MGLEPGAPIILGNRQHLHHPRSLDVRLFLNVLRERGGRENATPAQIYNEVAPQYVYNYFPIKSGNYLYR